MLEIIDTGINSAEKNMLLDAELLKNLINVSNPILHFYDWEEESLTYGYFLKPETLLDLDELKKRRIAFARRPTGGGIVFHIWDLAFSFLMPSGHPHFSMNPLDNYRFVNQIVLNAMEECFGSALSLTPDHFPNIAKTGENFCMARPTKYDVVKKGIKIAGAAQRLTKAGYLHQGTISLVHPDKELLLPILKSNVELVNAMETHAFCPLGKEKGALGITRKNIKTYLSRHFQRDLGLTEY